MIIFTTYKELSEETTCAIASWSKTFPEARIFIFGDFDSFDTKDDIIHFRRPAMSETGLPLLNDMFKQVYTTNDEIYLLINADCLITPDMERASLFLAGISMAMRTDYLAVGQRTEIAPEAGRLVHEVNCLGRWAKMGKHKLPACGVDWFLFNRSAFRPDRIPPFHYARYSYDNWLIYDALQRGVLVVDCSKDIPVYHMTHPEQKVRQCPDADENKRLARASYPKWDEWQGWINQATITLEELRLQWDT